MAQKEAAKKGVHSFKSENFVDGKGFCVPAHYYVPKSSGGNVHGSFYYQENASENSFDASSLCRVKIQGEKGFQKATTNKTY